MFRLEALLSLVVLAMTGTFAGPAAAPATVAHAAAALKSVKEVGAKAIRERLSTPVTLEKGIEGNTPLREALEFISDRYDTTIVVDAHAFKAENMDPIEDVHVHLPRMIGVKLHTILGLLLAQVDATYRIRPSHIEITTLKRTRPSSWTAEERGLAPMVDVEFEKCPLSEALQQLADSSGINVVLDGRAGDKAKTSVTATLNNVPIDTAVLILADMADLRPVAVDNVLYVTSKENAELLQDRQERLRKKVPAPRLEVK
jgi:hypothetical protein